MRREFVPRLRWPSVLLLIIALAGAVAVGRLLPVAAKPIDHEHHEAEPADAEHDDHDDTTTTNITRLSSTIRTTKRRRSSLVRPPKRTSGCDWPR